MEKNSSASDTFDSGDYWHITSVSDSLTEISQSGQFQNYCKIVKLLNII